MIYFFLGVALLALVLYALNAFIGADTDKVAKYLRIGGGVSCLMLAVILSLRGAFIFSIPIAAFGLGLMGWKPRFYRPGFGPQARSQMSREEALKILGLKPGATKKEILAAHKKRMKESHPDRGGSEEEAKKINMAKDVLIGK